MRKIATICAAALAASAPAQAEEARTPPEGYELVVVSEDETSELYLHWPTLERTKHGAHAWMLVEGGLLFKSTVTLVEFDCDARRMRAVSDTHAYTRPMAGGELSLSLPPNADWEHLPPNSMAEHARGMVCAEADR